MRYEVTDALCGDLVGREAVEVMWSVGYEIDVSGNEVQ